MGLKTSALYHPRAESSNSLDSFERNREDDSLRFAFSLPCAPSPQLHSVEMIPKSISLVNLNFKTPTYFLGGTNGIQIVDQAIQRLGWNRTHNRLDENVTLRWTESVLQINYETFKEGEQMVNHIPNCGLLTNKLGLLLNLHSYDKKGEKSRQNTPWMMLLDFLPETYNLDDINDRNNFYSVYKDGQTWIYKPTGLNQGKGIELVRTRTKFDKLQEERLLELRKNPLNYKPRIIQRYITKPLLLDDRKFDIRCYMFIASTMPYLVLFHTGYVRLSTRKYKLEDNELITHLTNQVIQKKDPNYAKMKENTVWSMDRFNDYVNKHYLQSKGLPVNWVKTVLVTKMQNICAHCFHSVKDKLACRIGFFEMYGVDLMIDLQMKVWLLEVNTNPALQIHCETLKKVLPPIIEKFIDISVECFEKARRWKPLLPLNGISPLVTNINELEPSQKAWVVSLKATEKKKEIINMGLPQSFTLLYSENLEMAKSRQQVNYNIPLQTWISPSGPRLDSGEGNRLSDKANVTVNQPLVSSSSKSLPISLVRNGKYVYSSTTLKPKQQLYSQPKDGKSVRRPSYRNFSRKLSESNLTNGGNKGHNGNCSVLLESPFSEQVIKVDTSEQITLAPPTVFVYYPPKKCQKYQRRDKNKHYFHQARSRIIQMDVPKLITFNKTDKSDLIVRKCNRDSLACHHSGMDRCMELLS